MDNNAPGEDQRRLLKRLIERTESGELRWRRQDAGWTSAIGLTAGRARGGFRAERGKFTFDLTSAPGLVISGAPHTLKVNERGSETNPVIEVSSSLRPLAYDGQVNELLSQLFALVDARVEDTSSVVKRILDDL